MKGRSGVYYRVDFELVMLFGGMEIEAQLCWKERFVQRLYQNLIMVFELTVPLSFPRFHTSESRQSRVLRRGDYFFFFLKPTCQNRLVYLGVMLQFYTDNLPGNPTFIDQLRIKCFATTGFTKMMIYIEET
jgi:hypothetical protein